MSSAAVVYLVGGELIQLSDKQILAMLMSPGAVESGSEAEILEQVELLSKCVREHSRSDAVWFSDVEIDELDISLRTGDLFFLVEVYSRNLAEISIYHSSNEAFVSLCDWLQVCQSRLGVSVFDFESGFRLAMDNPEGWGKLRRSVPDVDRSKSTGWFQAFLGFLWSR